MILPDTEAHIDDWLAVTSNARQIYESESVQYFMQHNRDHIHLARRAIPINSEVPIWEP